VLDALTCSARAWLANLNMRAHPRRSSRRALDMAFQASPDASALFDPAGRIVLWNKAFADLIAALGAQVRFGLTESALLDVLAADGLLAGDGLPAGDGAMDARSLGAPSSPADRPLGSTESALPDGRIVRVDRRLLSDGGVLAIVYDVTEQRLWSQAIQEAREKAEAESRAKSEILSHLSHELRTPLKGVLGMVQAIERDDLSWDQRVRIEVVHQSAGALLGTLDGILDLAKIEAGRTDLAVAAFDVVELILSVSARFTAAAVDKGLYLHVAMAPDAVGWWLGDAAKLRRVLAHLIDNGLKFTPTGGVNLEVVRDGGDLVFRVEDTGVGSGIGERVLDDFVQGDDSTGASFGCAGVGLSLCRAWVLEMGGVISAYGAPGRGACFTVRLSLDRTEAPDPVSTPARQPGTEGETPTGAAEAAPAEAESQILRVLAAEDNETNQLVLRALLQSMEVDLTVVENGCLALGAFAAEPFDLILMDIQMPEMNGLDAARAIRSLEREQGRTPTPIIALTANVMPDQVANYRAAGMDDCVAKPIELERLFNAMAAALDGQPGDGVEAAA
jgi:signal transduction histidine kinase/ActR/RegA family two-component response regulator